MRGYCGFVMCCKLLGMGYEVGGAQVVGEVLRWVVLCGDTFVWLGVNASRNGEFSRERSADERSAGQR